MSRNSKMWGKVSSYARHANHAVKGGIALAQRAYTSGMKGAGMANQAWNAAQRIGGILAPHLERYQGGQAITDAARSGAGQVNQARDQAMTRYADVRDRMQDHSRALTQIRAEIPSNFVQQ